MSIENISPMMEPPISVQHITRMDKQHSYITVFLGCSLVATCGKLKT